MYLKYLWYLIKHKWFVMIECFKHGLFWRGLVHDLSKFRPSEFFPYARHFFGPNRGKRLRDATGYYEPTDTGDRAFDFAWFLHQKRNDHHWQYWTAPKDARGVKIFEMPRKAVLEMLCDWRGAERAQGTPNTRVWYEKNGRKIRLHEKTRSWIEDQLFKAEAVRKEKQGQK